MARHDIEIAQRLGQDISDEVGNGEETEIQSIMSDFDKLLARSLGAFSSPNFDSDGIIGRLQTMTFDEKHDKDTLTKILNGVKNDYPDITSITDSEMMLRRDISNICQQMPEMREVIYIVRDAIIEADVATGNVSRTISFQGTESHEDADNDATVELIEEKFNLLTAIKNYIIPQTLTTGEMYVNVVPYKKLFAEVMAASDKLHGRKPNDRLKGKREPTAKFDQPVTEHCLFSDENLRYLTESVSHDTKVDVENDYALGRGNAGKMIDNPEVINRNAVGELLRSIDVYADGTSAIMNELGPDGIVHLLESNDIQLSRDGTSFFEDVLTDRFPDGELDVRRFDDIKGCYVKYLDPLRVVPVRLGQKPIGYCYVTTSMDLQTNPTQPNGVIDLTFQNYAKDRNLVNSLANLIIRNFNRPMLNRNIKLKDDIAEIVMEHRFNEGRLSFVYIPEEEIVRFVVNEDEEGRGHSIIEPSLFPARMYLMLTLYNMIYTLNNTTTRVHYLRSSGLNKDYSAQVQRAMRKFQSRRITIDDIHSYSGVLNKIGGIGEMVLPSGRGDYKALETDTIAAVEQPINMEFLELQRRQAISGTGVPALMIINAVDEIEFAKQLETANTRFLSTVSSYKIDFNRGLTKLYQLIMKYSGDVSEDVVRGFAFRFNSVRQPMLETSQQMIQNFNVVVETVGQIYFNQDELQTQDGKPTDIQVALKRELAEEFLPQFDYDKLDDLVARARVKANGRILQQRVKDEAGIEREEIESLTTAAKDRAGTGDDEI